ncbi:MAG: hypothetical protein V4501_10985 [Pseudomonadota bacterium]
MSPEKPTKNAAAQKQKIMIGIIVVVMLVVAWQLFGGGGGSAPAPTPTPTVANKPMTGSPGPSMAGGTGMPAPQVTAAPEMTQPKPAIIPVNAEILKLQQQTQADYLASVNKLQMLKMQREIDEAKTAIANAELSRMTAEKSIADLITSKESGGNSADMGPIGGMPSSPFGNPPQATTTTTTTTNPSIVVQAVPQIPVVPYNVLSVAYQGHKWSAVLGLDGKTMTVNVGDLLEDGSTVTSISRNKVTLKRDNKSRTLSVASNNI